MKKKGDLILIFILLGLVIILGIVVLILFSDILFKKDSKSQHSDTGKFENILMHFDENKNENGKIHIGDYIDYKPIGNTTYKLEASDSGKLTTQTVERDDTLKWRVLGLSENKKQILLISDKPTSGDYIYFKGINGYNNIVYLLNDICYNLYRNYSLGDARSINIEDILNKMSNKWDYHTYNNGITTYGKTKEYSDDYNIKFPNIFKKEKGQFVDGKKGKDLDLSMQKQIIKGVSNANKNITVKQTFWEKELTSANFIDNIYYELFVNNGSNYKEYFLASRCIETSKDFPKFGESRIGYGMLRADPLYFNSNEIDNSAFIRPIIVLNEDVSVDISKPFECGTKDHPWIIKNQSER